MCSPSFKTVDCGGFLVSEVWFPPRTVIPHHTHERAVVAVMLDGSFENRFRGHTLTVEPGDLFTEPGEEGHANHVGSAGARVLVLQPDPGDEELSDGARSILDEIRTIRQGRIGLSASMLSREIRHADGLSRLAIESLALDIMVTAARYEDVSGEPAWLRVVDEIIRDSFRERLTVSDIGRLVGVHRARLARTYARHRGRPIALHVRELRLEWAAERLAETEESISSIALQAGFSDQSHLTRAFKLRFGIPPGAYRRARGD